jgi:hypothetical protein
VDMLAGPAPRSDFAAWPCHTAEQVRFIVLRSEVAMKRLLFGVLWCIVLYFGACFLTGAIAGGMAGGDDPDRAFEAGSQAGAKAVSALRIYLIVGAVVLGGVGTWVGYLPGTRPRQT